jgi:hypothetical protein
MNAANTFIYDISTPKIIILALGLSSAAAGQTQPAAATRIVLVESGFMYEQSSL